MPTKVELAYGLRVDSALQAPGSTRLCFPSIQWSPSYQTTGLVGSCRLPHHLYVAVSEEVVL